MRKFAKIALLSALATLFQFSFAADIPWASSPEEVGMSSERLELINEVMQRHIEAGDIQGAVTAVARRGKLVHFEAHGLMDVLHRNQVKHKNPISSPDQRRLSS